MNTKNRREIIGRIKTKSYVRKYSAKTHSGTENTKQQEIRKDSEQRNHQEKFWSDFEKNYIYECIRPDTKKI